MSTDREFRGDVSELSNEDKILIVNGWDLLQKTREESARTRGLDLTCRMQIRSDCKALEKALQAVENNSSAKNKAKLKHTYLALKTSADSILHDHSVLF